MLVSRFQREKVNEVCDLWSKAQDMKKLWVVIVLVVLIGFIGFTWWNNGNSPVNAKDTTKKVFVIPKGAAVRIIGNSLKEQGLIKDPVVFFVYIKKNGLDKKIQAGSYKLSPSMSLSQIIDELRQGTVDVWITIPEGYRATEIAEVLKANIGTYNDNWIEPLEEQEGYLFPDTYLIPKDADIATIISILNNNFYSKIASVGLDRDSKNLSSIITMASLIEREALRDDEKPIIASVINNRLRNDMSLDIDATLQYVKGKNFKGEWWSVPTGGDKDINSPYNTYKNIGLPPGPIANPGFEAIRAAANPGKSDYYFYIHDESGKVHFARTLEEHNRNVEKYLR